MILSFAFISAVAIACLSFKCSASMIYSSLALGLCSINDIQNFLRSTHAETENVGLQKVLAVCDALNSSQKNLDYFGFSDILQDLNCWFEKFVRDNHLNEDGRGGEKPLTMKRGFRFFISALPTNVGSELFQIKPTENSQFAKPRVLDEEDEKIIDDASLPAFFTMTGSDHFVQEKIKLKSRNRHISKGRKHSYKLEMILAKQPQRYCSIFPIENKIGIAEWKVLSVKQDCWDQSLHVAVQAISDAEYRSKYSDKQVLYIYRRSGGQFGKETKSISRSAMSNHNHNLRQQNFLISLLHDKSTLILGAICLGVYATKFLLNSESFQAFAETVISGFNQLMNLSADDVLIFGSNIAALLFSAIFSAIFLWMIALGFANL